MWAPVVTALITGLLALALGLRTAFMQLQLSREVRAHDDLVREQDRARTEQEKLTQFREPLIIAAGDLANRIQNIQVRGFLAAYLDDADPHRGRVAMLGTLYRFARYWAV